ncbi:MAG TPA: hypothetical protein VFX02_07710 [Gammaproteobacteria bacterium]|nr:hypothetical protein [Gammaproteobacteria bacterium]
MRRHSAAFLPVLSVAGSLLLASCDGMGGLYVLETVMPVQNINFYGKIVDQYGQPVPGVIVKYAGHNSSTYSSGASGSGSVVTDKEGRFTTGGAEGDWLSIDEFIKPDYQFPRRREFDSEQRFEDALPWTNYTKNNPFIFKAWKIARYPAVRIYEEGFFLLTPDGRKSTFDLLAPDKGLFKPGVQEGDFTVSFDKIDDTWIARVDMLNGGILERDDMYMNLAPVSGYEKFVEYKFQKSRDTAEKKFYIKMRGGKYYAQMTIVFRAYDYRHGKGAIQLSYVVNLENGRDLVVDRENYRAAPSRPVDYPKLELGLPETRAK